MSLVINAHIKNENNKQIKVTVYNASTGIVEREKIFDLTPSPRNLLEVRRWLSDEYVQYRYTEEGFRTDRSPKIVSREGRLAEEGSVRARDIKPSDTIPTPHIRRTRNREFQGSFEVEEIRRRNEEFLFGPDEDAEPVPNSPDGGLVPGEQPAEASEVFTERPGPQSSTAPVAPATDCDPPGSPDPPQPSRDPAYPDPNVPYNSNMLPNGQWRSGVSVRGNNPLRINGNRSCDPGPYQSYGCTMADRRAKALEKFHEDEAEAFSTIATAVQHISE